MMGIPRRFKETQPTPVQESSAAAESKVSDAQETEEAQKQAGAKTLVVYSNTDEAGAKAMEDVGKEIGIEVTVVRLNGGGEVTDRIMAEKNNPTADIVYGINHIGFARLKAADCLQPFTPVWDDKVESGLKDPDGYYYGVGISQCFWLIIRKLWVIMLPQTDVLYGQNRVERQIFCQSFYFWRNNAAFCAVRNTYQISMITRTASLQEGWDATQTYYQNAYIQQEGDDFFAMLTKGDIWAGQNYSKGVLKAEADYNADIAWATPEAGVPFAVEMVLLMAQRIAIQQRNS